MYVHVGEPPYHSWAGWPTATATSANAGRQPASQAITLSLLTPPVTIADFNFNSLSHAAALAGSRPCSSVASGLSGTRHIISYAATAEANSRSARLGLKLERRLAGSSSILLFINPRACNLHARRLVLRI